MVIQTRRDCCMALIKELKIEHGDKLIEKHFSVESLKNKIDFIKPKKWKTTQILEDLIKNGYIEPTEEGSDIYIFVRMR